MGTTARADNFLGVNWPAIGLDAHPALVFVITDNGSGGFTVTPHNGGQGPFDGADDVYIGVINNSSQTINNMVVTGPNRFVAPATPLFGFDGDGIGSPTIPNHVGTNAQDTSPGHYGGTGAFFTNIAADLGSGTVNFIGGIAAGGHQIFSLETNPNALGSIGGGGVNATTPVPAGLVMAGMGALSLFGYGWRRRKPQAA
jgi:hypothetical protein